MLLSLITSKRYTSLYLPQRPEGQYFITDPENEFQLFKVFGESDQWQIQEMSSGRFVDQKPEALQDGMMLTVRIVSAAEKAFLYAQNESPRYTKFARCPVPDQFSFTYGSGNDDLFRTTDTYVSGRHFTLTYKNRNWTIKDNHSSCGTFVNSRRIDTDPVSLNPGDLISVLNQKFIVLPGLLAFNSQGLDTKRLKGKLHALNVPDLKSLAFFSDEKDRVWFHRVPRFTDTLDEHDISVQAPPASKQPGQPDKADTLLSMGPALGSGLIMMLGGMNPLYGIGMAVSSMLWPSLGRKRAEKLQKEEEEKRQKQYEEYLQRVDDELEGIREKQTQELRKKSAAPADEAKSLLNDKVKLWNRRPDQSDFLEIRMGIGDIPMRASIKFPQENEAILNTDPMIDRLHEIERKPRDLRNVPIILPLDKYTAVGVSGPDPVRMQMAEKMILQLAMHVGYDDLKICILGKLPRQSNCLTWLPHTWNDQKSFHFIAEDMDELSQLAGPMGILLDDYLDNRQDIQDVHLPHLVILITDSNIAQSGMLQRTLFLQALNKVHIITLTEHKRQLPSRTELAVSVREKKCRMEWQQDEERCSVDFIPDRSVTGVLEPMVSMMSNTFLDLKTEVTQIPDVVPFLNMFGVQDVKSLNLLSRWKQADPIHSLCAPIGISEDGNYCQLDLHEKKDGPHGLIAGTTGSGKSELIMSYILSAAVCYSPEELSFVLIDYKGGGMAQAFEGLPHTVGIITNLDGNEINRSLMSIQSELQRRQQIFSNTERSLGVKKPEIYRYQQLYREGKVSEPLPHLVIISDEFAELKSQEPEFLQQLISAARIGRSLGVHLILATQKPAGVVDDQIWGNSNFRLCLRVQDPRDSQDVLKCPDAASITQVGRFYKQVGYGKNMIKAQSAYTGADYTPGSQMMQTCVVDVLGHSGQVISRGEVSVNKKANSISQLDAVSEYIAEIGKREKFKIRKLWLPVLEEKISLSLLNKKYHVCHEPWILNPVIGELDDPSKQSRSIVRFNLSEGRNAIVYGAIGSGKLQFVTTVLVDLMVHHTPEELQIYILDYADDGLQIMTAAPHIGDVLYSDDDEKLIRFISTMEDLIKDRKRKLGGAMASGSLEQRLQNNGMCNILVVLHHLLTIQNHIEDRIGDLIRILSDGPRYGIFFLATAEMDTGIRFSLQQRFAQRYVLQQDQDEGYMALLGRTGGMKPMPIRGRGLIRDNDKIYEFQTAMIDGNLQEFCEDLRDNWTGITAQPIKIMPNTVTSDYLMSYLDSERPLSIPVGLDVESLDPVFYPFDRGMLHLFLGMDQDVSMVLTGLLPLFIANGIEATAFDPDGNFVGIDSVESLSLSQTEEQLEAMFEECKRIKKAVDDGSFKNDRSLRLFVIPSISSLMNRLSDNAKDNLKSFMLKARSEWKWVFILGDMPQNLNTLRSLAQTDSHGNRCAWFDTSISKTDVLLAGVSLGVITHIQMNCPSGMLYQSNSFPGGYIVVNGAVNQIRLVSGQDLSV